MIQNSLELSKFLCDQAKDSGFAKTAVVIILDHDGNLSKTEFGFVHKDVEDSPSVSVEDMAAGESTVAVIDESKLELVK